MSSWRAGYVADSGYVEGYYHQQTPAHLAASCLLRGVECEMPRPDADIHYLELGCGYGFTSLILAASNPGWRVTAIDFNPAHIAAGRRVAAEAGIDNIAFLEADLATLPEDALSAQIPEADFASLHGLWSWVTTPVRAGIIRLLRRKVRAGGVVHVSYNCLPNWQGGIALRRLVEELGRRTPGTSDRQAAAGLAVAGELAATEAKQLANPFAQAMLDRLKSAQKEYLAHEFMNESNAPAFHADVARDLAEAKLDWVASAQLLENFPDLTLSAEQRAIADRFEDPLLWELVKDSCIARSLRHDVFVRGVRRLDRETRDRRIGELRVALLNPPDEFSFEINVPAGPASIERGFYGRVAQALGQGVLTVAELDRLRTGTDTGNPAELLGVLLGTEQALLVPASGAVMENGCRRLNRATVRRQVRLDALGASTAAASLQLGGGLPCSQLALFVIDRLVSGVDDIDLMAVELGPKLEAADRTKLRDAIGKLVQSHRESWRSLGML